MRPRTTGRVSVAMLVALAGTAVIAFELKPRTLAAFDRYAKLAEARMAGEVAGASPFLWIDRQPEKERAKILAQLGRGEVVVARLETRDGRNEIDVPNGMIHHWIGTVLLPGVPLAKAIAFVQEYDRYPARFAPTIQRAKVLKHEGNRFEVYMRTSTKKVITVVIDADYVVDYQPVTSARVSTKSVATNVREIQEAGEPGERAMPGDQAGGFLWRLNNYCSFEARPEGTYEQCESISLTRPVPWYAPMRPAVRQQLASRDARVHARPRAIRFAPLKSAAP